MVEGSDRALGLQGDWEGTSDWFGGQVQQVARIYEVDKRYHLRLEQMEMRKSNRLARFLGSRHLIQFKLPDKFDNGEEFLLRKFVLCGRVFVPFHAKDGNVYLLEVKEDFERLPLASQGDQHRLSFEELINWHNPMALNEEQVCTSPDHAGHFLIPTSQTVNKWIARFDLALSTSIPALKFSPENIYYLHDQCELVA